MIDMTPAPNNRLDHIAEIKADHDERCWLPGCPENVAAASRGRDAITIEPKEQTK